MKWPLNDSQNSMKKPATPEPVADSFFFNAVARTIPTPAKGTAARIERRFPPITQLY
jgi:hypothetical protein